MKNVKKIPAWGLTKLKEINYLLRNDVFFIVNTKMILCAKIEVSFVPRNRDGGARHPVLWATCPGMPRGARAQYIDRYMISIYIRSVFYICLYIYRYLYKFHNSYFVIFVYFLIFIQFCNYIIIYFYFYTFLYVYIQRFLFDASFRLCRAKHPW